jgi:predicted transcriptional regulator
MAKNITQDEIIQMNELYLQLGTYSGVAKVVGRAPSTVKKYIQKDYVPQSELVRKIFKLIDMDKEFDPQPYVDSDDWGKTAVLTDEEKEEVKELWKEMSI